MKTTIGNGKRGITLIALIITVIVMLILAGVSISVLTGGGGLFEKTTSAAEEYNQSGKNEADTMQSWMNQLDGYLSGTPITPVDTTNPTVAIVASSNVEGTTFTLTATGQDETSIQKYEFYINGTLEKTETTTEGTATYNVTGKAGSTNYTCKVIVYDAAGNYKESEEIIVTTKTVEPLPIATTVQVGDYVNYDAGNWNSSTDASKITSSGGTVTWSSSLPTTQGQFGGFTNGQSRNENSTPYSSSYAPRTAGWRVWDIDSTTGV